MYERAARAVAGWTELPSATLPSLKPNGSRAGIRGESGAVRGMLELTGLERSLPLIT